MARVFVSHSSADQPEAASVASWLSAADFDVFFSPDPDAGIPGGFDWEQYLHLQLKSADALVVLNTEHARSSPWVAAELAIARSLGTPVVPLARPGEPPHPVIERIQAIPWESDDAADAALTRRLGSLALAADSQQWDPQRGPYPGLRPFTAADAGVFFGREDLQDELLRRLRRPVTSGVDQVVVVVGASGSGKSSLVRAGVAPRLVQEGRWVIVGPVRPRRDPVHALAAAVAASLQAAGLGARWERYATAETATDALAERPEELGRVLSALAATAGDGDGAVMLVIDQAEELLAPGMPVDARRSFLEMVTAPLDAGVPLRLVATLRSEFLARALEDLELRRFVGETVNVGPLDEEGMRAAILRPASRASIAVEPGLVDALVAEAGQPGGLPLVAYTLRLLWERAVAGQPPAGPLTLSTRDYDDLGGVAGVVRTEAEAAKKALRSQGAEDEVLPTLLEFVSIDTAGEWTAAPVRRAELGGKRALVVDQFLARSLLVTDDVGDDRNPEPIVEVAHETLFTAWPELRQAIEAGADLLVTRSRLRRNADEWAQGQAEPPSGPELESSLRAVGYRGRGYGRAARRWVAAERPRLGDGAAAYLGRGLRARRRRRGLVAWSALLGIAVLAGLTLFVVDAWRDRDRRIDATGAVTEFGAGVDAPLGPAGLAVDVGPFAIERHEVTVARYRKCVAAGACTPPQQPGVEVAASTLFPGGRRSGEALPPGVAAVALGGSDELYFADLDAEIAQRLPVTFVTAAQAAAFCEWIGRRLPHRAEWEWAARGGPDLRSWPWGDDPPTAARVHVNLGEQGVVAVDDERFAGGAVAGVTHLVGNVWEWTSPAVDGCDPVDRRCAPAWDGQTSVAALHVAGIGWADDIADWSSAAVASTPRAARSNDRAVGFRCLDPGRDER